MHFQKSTNIKLLLCSFISLNLFSQTILNDNSILSDPRKKTFELSKKQIKEDSSKLKKDWINPITYTYTNNFGEEYSTEKSVISINQPIFQSGGIYQAIKYANSTYNYASLEIEQQQKELIKQAVNLLYNIEKTSLNIQKADLPYHSSCKAIKVY